MARRLVAWLRGYGARVFGLDLRALAVFRIALGLTLLGSIASDALDYELLLTGRGVLPARAVWPPGEVPWVDPGTFYAIVDAPAFALGLLTAMAVAATLLTLGLWGRSSALFLWIALSFLVRRNPWTHTSAHTMTLFCLLWSLFLPTSARASLDQRGGRTPRDLPLRVASVATAGLVLQVALVYVTAARAKSGPEWHEQASAVRFVAHQERFRTPLTPLLALLPAPALAVLTRGVWVLEAAAPLLLLSPVRTTASRLSATLLLIGMHLGLGAFVRLGSFPWICVTYLVALLPRPFWDRVWPEPGRAPPGRAPGPAGPARPAVRALSSGAAVLLLLITVTSYLRLAPGLPSGPAGWARRVGGPLRIGEIYRLFSRVSGHTYRYAVFGLLPNGAVVDLIGRGPASADWDDARLSIAPDGSTRFPWIEYSDRVSSRTYARSPQALHYARYWCRAPDVAPLVSIEIRQLIRRAPATATHPRTASRPAYAVECRDADAGARD